MGWTKTAVALALAFVAAAPLRAAAQTTPNADWASVVEAAKKEGHISLYVSVIGAPYWTKLIDSFEKTYGIKVDLLDVRASELRERIRTEQTSGRFLGDITMDGTATLTLEEKEGVLQPHGDLPNEKAILPQFQATEYRAPVYLFGYGILINTRLIKPEDEPKKWADLTDPKWKGKIQSDDMRALGGGIILFSALLQKYGADFHRKLAEQNIIFSRDIGADERRVAQGEYPLRIPQLYSNYLGLKGLPVKLITPEEGAPYVQFEQAILKNAPHPNAGRLFINHVLSEEGQTILASYAIVPIRQGIADRVDPDMKALASTKFLGTVSPADLDANLALAKSIYK
ncbi:MAG: ABC transporter substrate-binding protein [Hyphomicrobiales bacterium]